MKEVAVGILLHGGRILACQRSAQARYPLKWEFPGGKLEPGEDPRQTLRRELREELDIEPLVLEEFHCQEWIYPEGVEDPARDGSFRVTYFLVSRFRGSPINRVFQQIRWVRPGDLLAMDFLEGNRDAIRRLLESNGTHAGS